jgi:hypothetical protein
VQLISDAGSTDLKNSSGIQIPAGGAEIQVFRSPLIARSFNPSPGFHSSGGGPVFSQRKRGSVLKASRMLSDQALRNSFR